MTVALHPRVFAVGDTAITRLAHPQVQLTRIDARPTFDLIGPRAAAGDPWRWLVDAAAAAGLDVEDAQRAAG